MMPYHEDRYQFLPLRPGGARDTIFLLYYLYVIPKVNIMMQ